MRDPGSLYLIQRLGTQSDPRYRLVSLLRLTIGRSDQLLDEQGNDAGITPIAVPTDARLIQKKMTY